MTMQKKIKQNLTNILNGKLLDVVVFEDAGCSPD